MARTLTEQKPRNRNLINLLLDIAIFIAFLIIMAPHTSGVAVHEWLSFAFAGTLIAHLLLHWQWIVAVTRNLFSKAQWSARISYILNVGIFIAMVMATVTGVMISREALPALGFEIEVSRVWRQLHDVTANLSLILTALHVAVHWRWIARTLGRLGSFFQRKPQPTVAIKH
ncbi:MAG: DUF4405 domain-containing protein [Roseiflexaceae bacterium]